MRGDDGVRVPGKHHVRTAKRIAHGVSASLVHAMAYPVGGEYHTPHGGTLSALVIACFDYIRMAKQEKMVRLAHAMGESVEGLSLREASARALDGIRHLIRSVGLPACLNDLNITDTGKISKWAVEAHKEQRLLSRSPRILSVEDIQKIYENAFSEGSRG